jgi:hypothetical protein
MQHGTEFVLGAACHKFNLSNRSDRSQSLTAESHSRESEKVFGTIYFGCGMPFKSKPGISLGHTLTVINHLNKRTPRIGYHDRHTAGTCINRVLHQYLDHRGGTLDNLSCSNLVCDRIGQKMYYILHILQIRI